VPSWAELPAASAATTAADPEALEADVAQRWERAATEASRPRFRPASVSGEAHAAVSADGPDDALPSRAGAGPVKVREGRFGSLFGSVVHHAIGLVLRDGVGAHVAVQRTAAIWALDAHIDEAVADVERALSALRAEGIALRAGDGAQIEYPVGGLQSGGVLLSGYIDLVAVTADRLDVIDFKTDAPPGAVGDYPAYAGQVRIYATLLEAAGVTRGRTMRCGLLFTADGAIRWIDTGTREAGR
jgi:ATP-dependent helicase/nuclease subunit A